MTPERKTILGNLWHNKKLGVNEEINMGFWADMLPDDKVYEATTQGVGGTQEERTVTVVGSDKLLEGHKIVIENGQMSGMHEKWLKKKRKKGGG